MWNVFYEYSYSNWKEKRSITNDSISNGEALNAVNYELDNYEFSRSVKAFTNVEFGSR